jgi:twinkle protein
MTDISQIKRMLADRAQEVAKNLLPAGKREGDEWRVGSIGGEAGQSLGIHLKGNKAGVWADFDSGDSGDLIDLWGKVKGLSLIGTLKDVKSYLGLEDQEPFHKPKREYKQPVSHTNTPISGKAYEYLVGQRGIYPETLATYKITSKGDMIYFPFIVDGELKLIKSRKAEDKAKPTPTSADCEPILFGWQAIGPDDRTLIITEGEIDALSWHSFGFPAVSVPFGGGKGAKQNWIENDYERLERFEKIYLSLDMDKPGEEAVKEIVSRIGVHRCYRVHLPKKDANECLSSGVSFDTMSQALKEAKEFSPEELNRPGSYLDEVMNLFYPKEEEKKGYTTPYENLSNEHLYFCPGELTLWSGPSGHGKSQVLSDCIPHWMQEGGTVCLASLEMAPRQSLKRLIKQVGNVDRPTQGYLKACMDYLDESLLIYNKVGKADVSHMLQIFDYAHSRYGCDIFIVDSLIRLGIASDDYTGQENAVYKMVEWVIARNVHLHLVAHSRKSERGAGPGGTEDVKGASEIGSNAFNILSIWRNREHEEAIAKATDQEKKELEKSPGVILNVAKNRNGDFEGRAGLWFDKETYRYRSSTAMQRKYVDYRETK